MNLKLTNFARAKIATPPSGISGLSFSVEPGKGVLFPTLGTGEYTYGVFVNSAKNREVVKIEARSGDSFTIATGGRGHDGTTAQTWLTGDHFYLGNVRAIYLDIIMLIEDHIADATDAHDAAAVSYDNTTSGLTATDVQAAIDELEARVQSIETVIDGGTY
jgi:hypothetical protein